MHMPGNASHMGRLFQSMYGSRSSACSWAWGYPGCCVASEEMVQAHAGAVSSLSLSGDGWVLASAGRDSVVMFWDLRKQAKLGSIPVLEPLEGAVFLPTASTPGRPAKKARTSAASVSVLAGLCVATAGSSGRLKVSSGLIGRTMLMPSPPPPPPPPLLPPVHLECCNDDHCSEPAD